MRPRAYFTRRSPSTTSQTCSTSYPKLNASASSYGSTQNGHSSGSGFTKHGPIRMYAFCRSRTRTCSRGCSSLNVSTRRAASLYALSSTSFAWYVLSPFFLAFFLLTCGSMCFICGHMPRNRFVYTTTSEFTSPGPTGNPTAKALIKHR